MNFIFRARSEIIFLLVSISLFASCSSKLCEEEFEINPLGRDAAIEKGFDFRAYGNEPVWQLLIKEDRIDFLTPQEEVTRRVFCIANENSNDREERKIILGKRKSDTIEINIFAEKCGDTMSGELTDYRAEVIFGKMKFSGCGEYLKSVR